MPKATYKRQTVSWHTSQLVANFLNLSVETISRKESLCSCMASWSSARKPKVKHKWIIYLFMFDYIELYRDDIKRKKDKSSFISHYWISTCQVKSKRGLLRTCVMSFSSARKYRDQQTIWVALVFRKHIKSDECKFKRVFNLFFLFYECSKISPKICLPL